MLLAKSDDHFNAVTVQHEYVRDHQIRLLAIHFANRCCSIAGLKHLMALALKSVAHPVTLVLLSPHGYLPGSAIRGRRLDPSRMVSLQLLQ